HNLGPHRNTEQSGRPVGPVPLAGRQHRPYNHRTCVDRSTLECVVEILAMRGRAVDERRTCSAEAAHMADCRTGTIIIAARERTLYIVLVARGDAEAGDIDQY